MNIIKLSSNSRIPSYKLYPKEFYRELMLQHGHVMIKNTGIQVPDDVKKWKYVVKDDLAMNYEGGTGVRSNIESEVLDTGPEPAHMDVLLHTEMSYTNILPLRVAFIGLKVANKGGATKIADTRKITKELPLRIYERFKEEGQIQVANYHSEEFRNLEKVPYNSWQKCYNVKKKEEFEAKMKNLSGFKWRWGKNDRLTLIRKVPAFIVHPITGEELWTNFILDSSHYYLGQWHPFNTLHIEERPFQQLWGKGERMSKEDVEEVNAIIDKYTMEEDYEMGDILAMDNLLTMHGRSPYEGERLTGVLMGDPIYRRPQEWNMDELEGFFDKWKYIN